MKGHWEKGRYVIGNTKAASWSKWGGTRQGDIREETPNWICQTCGYKQLKSFPEYFLLLDEDTREYVRICTNCQFRQVMSDARVFNELKIEIRTRSLRDYLATLATLASLPLSF